MTQLSLKQLLRKSDIQAVFHQLTGAIAHPFCIQSSEGTVLLGDYRLDYPLKTPITLEHETLGYVMGEADSVAIATLLSFLGQRELERKALARETLDRYKEISLLYSISEKITAQLDLKSVASLVLDEAKKLVQGNCGATMLYNAAQASFEIVAEFCDRALLCDRAFSAAEITPGRGIIGSVFQNSIGEIVNDVSTDPRCQACDAQYASLICTPLKHQDQNIGLLVLGSTTPINYTAGDLKRLNALASQASAAIENALLHEQELREARIKSNLERYVPAQVVQAIMESKGDISLAPVRKNITILFSDIRNFTTQCEELEPERIVGYLNEYFSYMVDIIFSHQGTVNKFVGDMIVALFGAPSPVLNHEKQAIQTAIAMQQCLQSIPIGWIRDNFHTGIGLSSGRVIVGNIGSPQHMDYTAIGDEVNTASRLQGMAQGGQILVSRSVYEATRADFDFKAMGTVQLKGKRNGIEVFEVQY